jgi:hypothetical protein
MNEKEYMCKKCQKKKKSKTQPECCGEPMKQLPLNVCTSASSPEDSRPMGEEEPCDDSRGG